MASYEKQNTLKQKKKYNKSTTKPPKNNSEDYNYSIISRENNCSEYKCKCKMSVVVFLSPLEMCKI